MTTITAPGFYELPASAYHADPAPDPSLSASLAKLAVANSIAHAAAHHPRLSDPPLTIEGRPLDRGSAMHELVLGGERRIVTIDADSYRTKAAKQQRDAIRASGRIPVLATEWPQMAHMLAALSRFLEQAKLGNIFAPGNGRAEISGFWHEADIWHRFRADKLDDRNRIIWDYKTTAMPLARWKSELMRDPVNCIQPAHYRRGARVLTGERWRFVFVVQEIHAPHAVRLIEPGDRVTMRAWHKLATARSGWKAGVRSGNWPAYPAQIERVDSRLQRFMKRVRGRR